MFFILKFPLLFYFFVAFDTQNLSDFRYKTLFFTYNFLYFFNVSYNFFVSYPLMIPSGSSQLTSTREGEARVLMGGWMDGLWFFTLFDFLYFQVYYQVMCADSKYGVKSCQRILYQELWEIYISNLANLRPIIRREMK